MVINVLYYEIISGKSSLHPVIARPVRTLVVAIRNPALQCLFRVQFKNSGRKFRRNFRQYCVYLFAGDVDAAMR